METSIKINLQEKTCDIEIKNLNIDNIKQLSTIGEAVAESLKSSLVLIGMDDAKSKEAVIHLMQGNLDIQSILRAIPANR